MSVSPDELNASGVGRAQFTTTHWSVILAAARDQPSQSAGALEALCRVYWYPLYAYVRRRGHEAHEAEDLTQEFFSRILQSGFLRAVDPRKGKFRSFLLAAMEHFLANNWRDAHAPEQLFEREWATALLEQVLKRLREEFRASGKAELFERLKLFLTGEKRATPYAELAAQLGTTEGALKMTVSRLKHRYGELLRSEIATTVAQPGEIEEELRALFAALSV